MLAPLDGQILHALQLSPRASFRRIGEVIGVPEQTVARRYRAMRRDSVLRVVGLVNPRVYGECQWVVRVHTKPEDLPRVAETLARRPEVTHANVLSGWTELVCIVRAPLGDSSDGLLHRLPRTSSVLSMDVDLVLHVFGESSGAVWTGYGHTLGSSQAAALAEQPAAATAYPVPPASEDRPLLEALAADGRTAHAQLAERTGWSPARVKRRINALEASTTLTYDVDVLPERLGFPLHAMVWMKMPPRHLPHVARQLLSHSEIASVIAVSGPNNLMAVVIGRDVDDLYRYLTEQLGTVDHIESYGVRVRTRRLKQAGSLISHGRLI
ncbi:Lrp/AsnC family transcriptional regulator [Mycolicibacterium sphagni]|uniref:Lrp/AsnC family transcriptional regulator n=1 Tax=Mycolicibacterium sphagni TaxID=1786 RepID=UPI0021F314D6|nr:Lrp/AsnC family transcriptional regulator [Mycolicibacterium sphagni]MCV7180220.1 Lrp/AsnC family transcriptional regulator [Mycolicibacterium sphagni]